VRGREDEGEEDDWTFLIVELIGWLAVGAALVGLFEDEEILEVGEDGGGDGDER
jgi:hypothetical protein